MQYRIKETNDGNRSKFTPESKAGWLFWNAYLAGPKEGVVFFHDFDYAKRFLELKRREDDNEFTKFHYLDD